MVTSVALRTRRSTVPAMTRFSRHDTESAGYRVKRKNRTAKNEWRNGKDATPYQARPRNRARNQGKSTDVAFYPLTDLRVLLSRECAAQERDRVGRQVGEIGECAFLHPVVVVAIALAEEG